MKLTTTTMARSDSEDVYEVTSAAVAAAGGGLPLAKLQNLEVDDTVLDKPNDTTIHSGHFMVSHVHDEPPDGGGRDAEEADSDVGQSGIDVDEALLSPPPQPGQSPCGGTMMVGGGGGLVTVTTGCKNASSLCIDGSLRKLFDCMTLAHCSKLTSPKWRNFKGVNVRLKDKIRLNNIIWREWHMQYIKGISPIVCHFETQISSKNDGTLDYWKLRLDSLTRDYKRLSRYFAHAFSTQPDDHELLTRLPSSYYELLQRVSQSTTSKMTNPSLITIPMFSANDSVTMDDEAIKDIFDTLFTPYSAPRGNSCNFNTQSSLEEFMDTLEPLPPPLAVDFRGFGRLSNVSGVINSLVPSSSMKLSIAQPYNSSQYNTATAIRPPSPQVPTISSQALSFGSAEEIIALLQSQLTSETSLECFISDLSPVIGSSGYPGTTIQSGFTLSDGSLVATDGAANIPLLPTDGIDMQDYPGDDTNQLCSMFFLPENTSLPVQSVPMFAPVDEMPETNVMACNQQCMQLDPTIENNLQLQQFLRDAARVAMSTQSGQSSLGSSSFPRMKSSHCLEEVNWEPRSLGNLQTYESTRGSLSNRSSNDTSSKQSFKGFRTPQNTGNRTLSQLQPRPQSKCSAAHRQEVAHAKQGTSVILPKQPVQPSVSAGDWSIIMTTGNSHLAVPILNQYAVGQDLLINSNVTAQGSLPVESKRRVRHKSDQSAAAKGATIRPIAVFQPINPLETASSAARTSSKTNCSVSFSLDKNTTISPSPMIDPSMLQVHNLSSSIILSAPGNSVAMSASNQVTDGSQKRAFGEIHSCPGIFETSFHSGDFSDSVSLNSSSARSRHTSNESNRSTSSHYDDCTFGVKNSKPKTETKKQSKELRRVSHITAEQKRRCNIKCGFDTLIYLIPELKDSSNSRVSKATALHKAADLCKKMKQERKEELREMEQLRNEIKALESDISACQSQLPATGAPPIKHPVEQLNERYDEYFYKRTLDNWKFFIFGTIIAQPLLKSFDEDVTRGSIDQFQKSVLSWVQTHCSLASLRPRVTNAMVDLSKQTSILSNPSLVPEEVKVSVLRHRNYHR